jgi:zinc transporter ZupT
VGALFLLAASVFLLFGSPIVGWTLTWIVVALAAVNLLLNFCAGCFMYYLLDRFGLIPHPERS